MLANEVPMSRTNLPPSIPAGVWPRRSANPRLARRAHLLGASILAVLATATAPVVLSTSTAAAQVRSPAPTGTISTGIIAGAVEDSLAAPVAGAWVSVAGMIGHGVSEQDGKFRLASIPPGTHTLAVRRIGFRPDSVKVTVTAGAVTDVRVQLAPNAQWVTPVVVEARTANYSGFLRGFYERRDRGIGVYFTAADIEARRPRAVTDLLRTVPGTHIVPSGGQYVVSFRDRNCLPLVWIDGNPATTSYLDPDLFEPHSLAGIEVYKGTSTVPAALMGTRGKGSCGVIALWTKRVDARPKSSAKAVTAEDLANLVMSLKLHTADQVDVPAAVDSTRPISPVYPDALLSAAVPGRVVVEFVVDTSGRPDMNTFGTVTTTHTQFVDAVRRAVAAARFTPAMLGGRRVLQLVQMPFSFTVPKP